MIDLDKILNEVINDASSIGFPISDNLERKIHLDFKRYDRVGACYRYPYPEKYEIHLSEPVIKAKTKEIKNIMAHEVLHSSFFSMDHGFIWSMYKNLMNEKLKYNIKTKYSWHEILKK